MKRILIITLAALASSNPAPAQEDNSRLVKFRVLCFDHVQETFSASVIGENGSSKEVDFYTGGFGPQIGGRFTDGKARFFIETRNPGGEPTKKIVAEGNLLASTTQMFLLFPAKEGAGMPYRIHAYDDLEKAFPMGSTRVINIASSPIKLNLAGADMPPIEPGGVKTFPIVKAVDEWNMYSASIAVGLENDTWMTIATQSWKASERKRDWVIVHIDPLSRQPALRLYQDIPPWRIPVPEAAAQ